MGNRRGSFNLVVFAILSECHSRTKNCLSDGILWTKPLLLIWWLWLLCIWIATKKKTKLLRLKWSRGNKITTKAPRTCFIPFVMFCYILNKKAAAAETCEQSLLSAFESHLFEIIFVCVCGMISKSVCSAVHRTYASNFHVKLMWKDPRAV